jgi:hypothetical protein
VLKQGAPEKCWVQGSLAFDVQNARSLYGTQYTREDQRATGTAAGCFGETPEARGPSPYLEDRGTQPSYAVVPCMPGIENRPSVSIQTNGNAQQSSHRLWQPTVSIRTPTKPTSPPATPPLPMPRPPNRFTTHPLTQLSREEGTCPPVRLQMDCWKRKNQQRTRQLTMKLGHEKQNVVAESVQLFAPCPQSTANGGLSNMVQGTRAHMEHTGWRHQPQRQDTHNLTAPTTRRTNVHQVQSYTLCQTNCSSARDGRRASYRQYMKTVGEPGHPGSAGRRPVVSP